MESKSSTNWCNLSPEMRTECVKWMDFKSRMLLRATASLEKSLVESAPKYHFDSVNIELDVQYEPKVVCEENDMETVKIEQKTGKRTPEFSQKAYNLVFQLLKFAVVDDFVFRAKLSEEEDVPDVVSVISSCSSLRFSRLALYIPSFEVVKAFLGKLDNPESVLLEISVKRFTEAQKLELMNMKPIVESKSVRLLDLPNTDLPYQLIQKWIDEDAEIGKKFQCQIRNQDCYERFVKKLENRTVPQPDNSFRLRTDNDSKHIVIVSTINDEVFLTIRVISVNPNPEDVKWNEQWAYDIDRFELDRMMKDMDRSGFMARMNSMDLTELIDAVTLNDPDDEAYQWD